MSEKLFNGILVTVTVLGVLSVACVVAYSYYLYGECSIISYIANGR